MVELLTVDEVANYLKIRPWTVRLKARKGDLLGYKIGKDWRFSIEEIKKFLSKCVNTQNKKEQ